MRVPGAESGTCYTDGTGVGICEIHKRDIFVCKANSLYAEGKSKEKQIQDLKVRLVDARQFLYDIDHLVGVKGFRNEGDDEYADTFNGVESMVDNRDDEIKALKERMKNRDDYLDSKCAGCPDCGSMGCTHPDLLTRTRKEVQDLKGELSKAKADHALIDKSNYSAFLLEKNDREKAEKENGELREQVAQMGEFVKRKLIASDNLGWEGASAECRELLSDYSPEWQEGKLREARDKAKLGIASYLEQFENSVNCDEMAQLIRDDVARQSKQPKQSREKS